MEIKEFQEVVVPLFKKDDEDTWYILDDLEIYLKEDGTLSAKFNGEAIPCESPDWSETLDDVATFIKSKRG